jgi:hopanoid biosynthesis associated protein HpnK
MSACRLIVHADDFGLSRKVNAGILDAHRHGILTSTSLIASGTAFDEAVGLSKSTPTLDVGVHLTLVGERPVLAPETIPTLVDRRGRFVEAAGSFMLRLMLGRVSLDDVRRELEAQISKVFEAGVTISHLDGHQHLHMAPGVRGVVHQLARKWRIPAMRYPAEAIRPYMLKKPGGWPRVAELVLLNSFCGLAPADQLARPDHFVGFYFGGRLSKSNLLTVLADLPSDGICELMCHPGISDPDSPYRSWNYHWQDERDALTDPDVLDCLRNRGVRLVSYRELRAAAR